MASILSLVLILFVFLKRSKIALRSRKGINKKLHEQVRAQIKKVNEQYMFEVNMNHTHLKAKLGDLAFLVLRKESFFLKKKEQAYS